MVRRRILGVLVVCAMAAFGGRVEDSTASTSTKVRPFEKCGTADLDTKSVIAVETKLSPLLQAGGKLLAGSVLIPVHVHVITDGKAGAVDPAAVQKQIDVLNAAFSGKESAQGEATAFRFSLGSYETVDNGGWYLMSPGSAEEKDAKTALHRGGPNELNLYVTGLADEPLGWSAFPWDVAALPLMDGVNVINVALPGGGAKRYNEGDVAVHEVGHWLGLYHLFQNGCVVPGDAVDDTLPEAAPSFQCGVYASCGQATRGAPADPWKNFMDYSDDACMWQFTHGQAARMNALWQIRGSASACGNGVVDLDELCDTGIAAGQPGACPTTCDDADACTTDTLEGTGTCQANCTFTVITEPKNGDGCCPPGATPQDDTDCPAV